MKTSLAILLLAAVADPYRLALPGYKFEFPRDHFSHPEFRTEWWYYTGNVRSAEGRRFGFELTFFRHAIEPSLANDANVWDVRDVWMAHLALSDLDGGRFHNTERMNRTGPGLAGVDAAKRRIWNGNWSAQWTSSTDQQLRGVAEKFGFVLNLHSAKPPVVHGTNGVSQKSEGEGRASHYVSLTRLETTGTITLEGKTYTVEGLSWMDHEFFTHSMESNQVGWDWFSLQFDDGSELMLYRLRRKDGTTEPLSSGTYIDPAGRARTLKLADFDLRPGAKWKDYPVEWSVRVPSVRIDIQVRTRLKEQELVGKYGTAPTYWEGAIEVSGSHRGAGYLEMTGYAGAVKMD